ncbi:DUF4979 domain-containing protein [Paraflavisolibacter sp. H34]|uniref:DUF4979 domain-containing protein n=1 Tax=Huijunlia imazamoxiresistens TaxID=3127457 RepID=UPI0030172F7C
MSKPRWGLVASLLAILLFPSGAFAQEGALQDDFSTGNLNNWKTSTAGASAQLVNNRLVITAALQANGKYRGDLQKTGGATLHAGTYPIVAIRINKPPRCNWFFDTNLGSYNNANNNATKIVTTGGNVYYWDLSTGKLGTTTLSTTQPTTLSTFQFKIADIDFSSTERTAQDYSYEVDWVQTFRSVDELRTFLNPSGTADPVFEYTGAFTHPGLLHTTADLARIKDLVTRQVSRPWKSYQLLLASARSSASYVKAGPFKYLTRDASLTVQTPTGTASGGAVKNGVEADFLAAYYNALLWNITGNEAHAQKAVEIIDAYSAYTVGIQGADEELNGLYGFILANAAELMRYTYPLWAPEKVQQCQDMLRNVFYPTLQYFRPCGHGNWDIICMKALMAIAVFSNDNAMYNKVVNYFYYGEGNGSIKNYVLTDAGQLQESNRDQPHSMLAIGSMAELAEMALKQGHDLYSAHNNAILRGYEYTAKYNLGYDVPYQTSYDFCEKNYQDYTPEAISAVGRGQFRAVFEIGYNHYVFRKSKSMPYTLEALGTVLNPEGAPFGADNPGYGSLFFYLNAASDYTFSGGSNTTAGLVNDNFNGVADGWVAATSGATATTGAQELTISMKQQTNGTYRGDFKRSAGAVVHAGNYPILAIRIKKPPVVNMTFDTNLGAFGNGANKWTGKVGDDIYYYDLTRGFGAAPSFLSTTAQTNLTTFQFKMADVPATGQTSYTVDWVKTFRSLNEVLAYDPKAGLVDDNFTTTTDGWATATTGATAAAANGQLQVALAPQANGSFRGDIRRTAGALLYPGNYPILAVKMKRPPTARLTFDSNLGALGNGSNQWTGKVGDDIYYYDLSRTGFGASGTLLTAPTSLTLFQLKVADITSGETSYQADWVKTVKTVEELQQFVAPRYQDILFPLPQEKKVGDADFSPATATSGLAVTYTSSNSEVATVVDGRLHLVGAGTTAITASQPGDAGYVAAEPVTRSLTVSKIEQVISFGPLEEQAYGGADFDAGATASSGLPVTYTSSHPEVAEIVNGQVRINGLGTTVLTAAQEGNKQYEAAPAVVQTLTVKDKKAPAQPQALTTTKTADGKVGLMWQASSDDIGVAGYYVFLNGQQLNEQPVNATSYVTEVPAGSLVYAYTVIAADAAGNLSAESATALFSNSNGGGSVNSSLEILKIFPNPNGGNFKVRLNSEQTGTVTTSIFNSSGLPVQSVSEGKSGEVYQREFRLQSLPKGMYLVRVAIGSFVQTAIVLIQ